MFVTRFHITGERKAERSDKSKPKAKARVSAESAPVKYWEIIADNLSKAGWTWGCVSTVDSRGRTFFVADPLSAGQPASEWFARTTESISYENLSEKVRIGSSNANIHARLVCAFAASGSRLPRRLLNESKHRPR